MSSRVYLSFPPRGHKLRPTSVTVSTLTSASNAVTVLSSPRYTERPDIALYAISPLFLLTTPSSPHCTLKASQGKTRFPNRIRSGNRPPLVRMSAPAHKSLLVHNIVSMLSHRVISTRGHGCPFKCHEEVLYLQPLIPPKRFDISPP